VLSIAGASLAQDQAACDGTTYEMRMCLSKIYQKSDAELNAGYRAVLQKLGPHSDQKRHAGNLRTAERRWIAYRDAQCKAQYDLFEGGTGGPLENLGCLIEMTDLRTAELKRVYLSRH
jgi:uncharacterized protein YecT (DUF1311 family)